jgi:hypothetical protein
VLVDKLNVVLYKSRLVSAVSVNDFVRTYTRLKTFYTHTTSDVVICSQPGCGNTLSSVHADLGNTKESRRGKSCSRHERGRSSRLGSLDSGKTNVYKDCNDDLLEASLSSINHPSSLTPLTFGSLSIATRVREPLVLTVGWISGDTLGGGSGAVGAAGVGLEGPLRKLHRRARGASGRRAESLWLELGAFVLLSFCDLPMSAWSLPFKISLIRDLRLNSLRSEDPEASCWLVFIEECNACTDLAFCAWNRRLV